nr:hypothetical protein [Peristeroidobacter soli]
MDYRHSWPQQHFDGTAFVHGAISFGDLCQRERQVKDLARIDLVTRDQIDEVRQKPTYRRRATMQVYLCEEKILARNICSIVE